MKKIKLFLLSIMMLLTLSANARAEFFSDIIVTSPNAIWTDSRAYSNLPAAITAVGALQRTVVISSQQSVGNITIPANVTLKFERDGAIIHSGQLTFDTKNIIAENRQIMAGAGDVDFASGTEVKSGWFADFETAANLTSDDTITLIVTKAQTLTSSQALGDHVILKWETPGNILTANAGVTISNINQVESGNYQLFAGAGNFRFRDETNLNSSWFAHLRTIITWVSTSRVTLTLQGTLLVDLTDIIPTNIHIDVDSQRGLLSISGGVILTINSNIQAGPYQWFSGAGTVVLTSVERHYPEWYSSGTFTQATIAAALTAIGTTNKVTLLLRPGTWVISSNADWSAYTNVTLKVVPGALLQIAPGVTLTTGGPLEAGLYQVFDCVGTGLVILGGGMVSEVYPQWTGTVGDGTTDDTVNFQKAADMVPVGGVYNLAGGSYLLAKVSGTNDKWGCKFTTSGVTVRGNGATIRRYDTDMSTYAKAYPLFFVGMPDSNVAPATENVTIEGITFVGEDTRHLISGNHPSDLRDAIHIKNTKGLVIQNNKFTKIDSSAIYFQYPTAYDFTNSVYYNLTKSYNTKIINNSFIAEPHAVVGRAYIHAIVNRGVDNLIVTGNYFEWCDACIAGEGTYDDVTDVETDTYAPGYVGWTLGNVKRSNRGLVFSYNTVYNSSEHVTYTSGMDVTITGNIIRTDAPTICTGGDIKVRSRNTSVSGNTITCGTVGISVMEPAFNVTVTGNIINTNSESEGGAIEVSTAALTAFLAARAWYATYYPMSNIVIEGNTIQLPATSQTYGYAIRLYTGTSDANYPVGQIQGIVIKGNTIRNHKYGVYIPNGMIRGLSIIGNSFFAKPFTTTAYDGSDMITEAAVLLGDANADVGYYIGFNDNTVFGSHYLFATETGGGTNVHLPWGIVANKFNYITALSTADFRALSTYNQFSKNSGNWFLDRTWNGYGTDNALGDGSTTNSYLRYNTIWNGTHLLFYTDDSATTKTLDN